MWPFAKRSGPALRPVTEQFHVTGQIRAEDLPALAKAGFRTLICTRPDHEEPGQPTFVSLAAEAGRLGLMTRHIPVSGNASAAQVAEFRTLMAQATGPVLGWCRSGARAETLFRRAQG